MTVYQSRPTLFQNRWLEKLTLLSAPAFIALWAVLLPAILWTAWGTATPMTAAGLTLAGGLIWTLTEYALHRFLFHWEPASVLLEKFVFIMHGNHHAVPNDPLRNLMPPMVSIPVGLAVGAGFVAMIGPSGVWLLLGFMTGYVAYDLVHYACHQWPMKGRVARMLKQHHMRHHHAHDKGNYAITGMMWDRLFVTRLNSIKRPATASQA
ncbi:sterol desaturase family protein [Sandarakinorhabdus sp.]|uniref:sterol desaturase family protein n=1 Tax=Sandarakinorhabdus sp. TaxID=1916663 RepID=UPI00333E424D